MRRPIRLADGSEEQFQLLGVEAAVAAHAAAQVDAEGADLLDGGADVAVVQAAGKKDGQRGSLDDAAAEAPVVDAAGAAQLLDRQRRIARIKQQGVGFCGGAQRLLERSLVADVDDLHHLDRGQDETDGGDRPRLGGVNKLDYAGLGTQVMGSDGAPGPLGMEATRPNASAPNEIASRASSSDWMQQILTRVFMETIYHK